MSDPDWATKGNDNSNSPINSSSSSANANDEHPHKKMFLGASAVINLGLSFMIAATGAIAIGDVNNVDDSGQVFVGLYMILFSAILFAFEVLQMKPNNNLDEIYKRNFGFLYGNIGKPCYLLL